MFNLVLIVFFIIILILIIVLLGLSLLLSPKNPDPEKLTTFECGFSPVYGQTHSPFYIGYFLVAILFLILDIEVFFGVPLSTSLDKISIYGFTMFIIFFGILTIGFVYELNAKVVQFTSSTILPKPLRKTD